MVVLFCRFINNETGQPDERNTNAHVVPLPLGCFSTYLLLDRCKMCTNMKYTRVRSFCNMNCEQQISQLSCNGCRVGTYWIERHRHIYVRPGKISPQYSFWKEICKHSIKQCKFALKTTNRGCCLRKKCINVIKQCFFFETHVDRAPLFTKLYDHKCLQAIKIFHITREA